MAFQNRMDTLGFEPRAFRMRSGCDTTTPCALEVDTLVRAYCVTSGAARPGVARNWATVHVARSGELGGASCASSWPRFVGLREVLLQHQHYDHQLGAPTCAWTHLGTLGDMFLFVATSGAWRGIANCLGNFGQCLARRSSARAGPSLN